MVYIMSRVVIAFIVVTLASISVACPIPSPSVISNHWSTQEFGTMRLVSGERCRLPAQWKTYRFDHGAKFLGELKDGLPHGSGVSVYPDGRKYVGEFHEGRWSGPGTVTFPDGSVSVGLFREGRILEMKHTEKARIRFRIESLSGLYRWKTTLTFREAAASFSKSKASRVSVENPRALINVRQPDAFTGIYESFGNEDDIAWYYRGSEIMASGMTYVGEFRDYKYHGQGTLILPDGEKYVGEFRAGKYHGHGTLNRSNKTTYKGSFRYNEYHGQGVLYDPDGLALRSGSWSQGILIRHSSPTPGKQPPGVYDPERSINTLRADGSSVNLSGFSFPTDISTLPLYRIAGVKNSDIFFGSDMSIFRTSSIVGNAHILSGTMTVRSRQGDSVRAIADGTVIVSKLREVGGHLLYLRHHQNLMSVYGNLQSVLVNEGDEVRQGQRLGEIGEGGELDLWLERNQRWVDPLTMSSYFPFSLRHRERLGSGVLAQDHQAYQQQSNALAQRGNLSSSGLRYVAKGSLYTNWGDAKVRTLPLESVSSANDQGSSYREQSKVRFYAPFFRDEKSIHYANGFIGVRQDTVPFFGNYLDGASTLEQRLLEQHGAEIAKWGSVRRVGNALLISPRSGRAVILRDNFQGYFSTDVGYRVTSFMPSRGILFLNIFYYEGAGYLALSLSTGEIIYVEGEPLASPDEAAIAFTESPGGYVEKPGIAIVEFTPKGLAKKVFEWRPNISDFDSIANLSWESNDKLVFDVYETESLIERWVIERIGPVWSARPLQGPALSWCWIPKVKIVQWLGGKRDMTNGW